MWCFPYARVLGFEKGMRASLAFGYTRHICRNEKHIHMHWWVKVFFFFYSFSFSFGWRTMRRSWEAEKLTTVSMKSPVWPLLYSAHFSAWQNSSCYGIFCLSNRLGTKSKVSTFPNDILRSAFIFYVSYLEAWLYGWTIFTRWCS